MPKPKSEPEYISNNSFMTSQVKIPKPFGSDYEDPLDALKADHQREKELNLTTTSPIPTTPTTPSPSTLDIINKSVELAQTGVPTTPSPTIPSIPTQSTKTIEPVSPTRDFQKVSNSITREAIPSGIFGSGKAKQLYDALYSLTRGAIRPIRVIRITKPRLMKLAGIGTRQTLWLNLEHLERVGLVRKNVLLGEHGGNEYEVFVPEELPELNTIPTSPTSPTNRVYQVQNLEGVVGIDSIPTTPSSEPINTGFSDTPKTSFKDNTKNDDDARVREAFSEMEQRLDAAVKKLSGKGVSRHEAEKWGTLAELLILEMEAAASRTDSISSVPAFLTEVLRRKLLGGNVASPTPTKSSKIKPDTVGKPNEAGEYETKPLSQEGREAALFKLREFAGEDFLADFEKWYTAEDWMWLTSELDKIKPSQKN